jgi:hypothetical protein
MDVKSFTVVSVKEICNRRNESHDIGRTARGVEHLGALGICSTPSVKALDAVVLFGEEIGHHFGGIGIEEGASVI